MSIFGDERAFQDCPPTCVPINLGFAYLLIDKVAAIGREITRKRVSVNAGTVENKLYAL